MARTEPTEHLAGRVVDAARLEAWLSERRDAMKLPTTAAIYEGLRTRLARGQFDIGGRE